MNNQKRVAIVGAGVSGLTAAFALQNKNVRVTLFEAADSPGGVLSTENRDDFLIEHSADMFVTDPSSAIQLCEQIGFADQLIPTIPENRFSSIVREGKLCRTPAGFSLLAPNRLDSIMTSPLLSSWGKLRFLMEYFHRKTNSTQDESLKTFTTRHFGRQVFERIVQPLVSGIYSANAEVLSVRATLERFVRMEQQFGSLIKAARQKNRHRSEEQESSGARYGMFVTPQNGFGSLIRALIDAIPNVQLQTSQPIDQVKRTRQNWALSFANKTNDYDAVILSTPAKVAARLVASEDESLAQQLSAIQYGSMIVIAVICQDHHFVGPPEGFGFVVPEIENRRIIACSFSSNKFPNRAPSGHHVIRVFIGGKAAQQLKDASDETLINIVDEELSELISFTTDENVRYRVLRWNDRMPQYTVGHLERIDQIQQTISKLPALEIAGSSYFGVGIPACIQSGLDAASRIQNSI